MKQKLFLWFGITIIIILIVSTFIKIQVDSGTNYGTNSLLLGILIFYSPIVLLIYIAIALFLIWKGLGKKIKFV